MFERFTDRARRVVVLAQEEARMLNHNYIGTEHVLLGLISEGEGVAARVLRTMGVSLEAVRFQVEEIIGQGQTAPPGHLPFTPRAKKVLELSLREALQLGHNYIGTEHILLGLIREGEGVAAQVLQKMGGNLQRVREQVVQTLSGYPTSGVTDIHEGVPEIRHHLGKYVFSEEGWAILETAKGAATDLGRSEIGSVDFLLAVITADDARVAQLLDSWGVDIQAVRAKIEQLATEEETIEGSGGAEDDASAT
jgi:ATP-dependent Clp protease ATP-binding subunit ClpC